MKAIMLHQFGGLEVMQYEDAPTPAPAEGQALIKVSGAGVNFADLMRRQGDYPGPSLPCALGLEAAGTVEALGPGVTGFSLGQPVMGMTVGYHGAYAEYAVFDAHNLFPVPSSLDLVHGGGVPIIFLTAYHMLKTRVHTRPGETVLIQAGASGVGTAAIQLGKAWGASVIVTASTQDKLELCRSLGADHAINYLEQDFEVEVANITAGQGVDVVLECVGGEVFEKSLRSLSSTGRIVIYGRAGGSVGAISIDEVYRSNRAIHSFSLGREPRGMLDNAAAVSEMNAQFESGALRLVLDRVLPLHDAPQAHAHLASRGARGKVVLQP